MSKRQTRRTVSLTGRTYSRLQEHAAMLGCSISSYVERLILDDLAQTDRMLHPLPSESVIKVGPPAAQQKLQGWRAPEIPRDVATLGPPVGKVPRKQPTNFYTMGGQSPRPEEQAARKALRTKPAPAIQPGRDEPAQSREKRTLVPIVRDLVRW